MAQNQLKIKHSYDKDADVLYVRFNPNKEPTFVENVDDLLLFEIGWFTGLPKGFRILGPHYQDVGSIKVTIAKHIKKQLRQFMEEKRKAIKEQEPVFASFCDKLPSILSSAH
jgi:hypothetical protein